MKILKIMTKNPVAIKKETSLQQVAELLAKHDCGALPVINGQDLGIITDRDIVCRVLAKGLNPLEKTAADAMTTEIVTVREDAEVQDAVSLMKEHQVRRLLVVNAQQDCVGIVSQADIAMHTSDKVAGDLVEKVSMASA